MRILRRTAAVAALLLVAVLALLARLGGSDPTVDLRRALADEGYADVSLQPREADADKTALTIRYDPEGQAAAAVAVLSRRAAERAWTTARIDLATVTVEPRGAAAFTATAEQLAASGAPPPGRERFGSIDSRARRVVLLAVVAVLLTGVLVVTATIAAVTVARRRRLPGVAQLA